MQPDAPPWTFNPTAVFHRLDAFLKRLADIEWLFHTVLEFSKLAKIEIGGILGRSLSTRVVGVFKEFQQLFAAFSARASDVLEPDDETFAMDCKKFNDAITDLDSKLAAILCQAFDDCGNLESTFKVCSILIHGSKDSKLMSKITNRKVQLNLMSVFNNNCYEFNVILTFNFS